MSLKIVTYDLGGPETSADYKKISDYLRTFGTRCKPLWMLDTTVACSTIRDHIKQYLDPNDKLLVYVDKENWASYGLQKADTDWLKNR